MQSINFNDGYKTYAINGDESNVIRVNTRDFNIVTRYNEMTPMLDETIEKYKQRKEKAGADEIKDIDNRVRKIVDDVFNADVSNHAFGNTHSLTLLDSGKFLVESFLEAFMPIIENDVNEANNSLRYKLDTSKAEKYLKDESAPLIPLANPGTIEKIDVSKLSAEEKEKILTELFK